MKHPVVYGSDYSVYVRIVRLALEEKGVDYELVPVDIFADTRPAFYRTLHPFGRIPAFEHHGFSLYETGAITRYIDETFGGPALMPETAEAPGPTRSSASRTIMPIRTWSGAIMSSWFPSRPPKT